MPSTGYTFGPGGQVVVNQYCDERLVGDAEGAAVTYPCGRALRPDNTSGKCDDHAPKAEVPVASTSGAAHLRLEVLPARATGDVDKLAKDPDDPTRGWLGGSPPSAFGHPRHVPAFCGAAVFPLDGAPREACGKELPCPDHGTPGLDALPSTPLVEARKAYEAAEQEVADLGRARDGAKARYDELAKQVSVAAHRAAEALKRYQEALRS